MRKFLVIATLFILLSNQSVAKDFFLVCEGKMQSTSAMHKSTDNLFEEWKITTVDKKIFIVDNNFYAKSQSKAEVVDGIKDKALKFSTDIDYLNLEKVPNFESFNFFSFLIFKITVDKKSFIKFSDISFEKPSCI